MAPMFAIYHKITIACCGSIDKPSSVCYNVHVLHIFGKHTCRQGVGVSTLLNSGQAFDAGPHSECILHS